MCQPQLNSLESCLEGARVESVWRDSPPQGYFLRIRVAPHPSLDCSQKVCWPDRAMNLYDAVLVGSSQVDFAERCLSRLPLRDRTRQFDFARLRLARVIAQKRLDTASVFLEYEFYSRRIGQSTNGSKRRKRFLERHTRT